MEIASDEEVWKVHPTRPDILFSNTGKAVRIKVAEYLSVHKRGDKPYARIRVDGKVTWLSLNFTRIVEVPLKKQKRQPVNKKHMPNWSLKGNLKVLSNQYDNKQTKALLGSQPLWEQYGFNRPEELADHCGQWLAQGNTLPPEIKGWFELFMKGKR